MCKKNPGIFFTHFDKWSFLGCLSKCVKKILGFFLHILVFGLKTGMCKKNPRIFFTHFCKHRFFGYLSKCVKKIPVFFFTFLQQKNIFPRKSSVLLEEHGAKPHLCRKHTVLPTFWGKRILQIFC